MTSTSEDSAELTASRTFLLSKLKTQSKDLHEKWGKPLLQQFSSYLPSLSYLRTLLLHLAEVSMLVSAPKTEHLAIKMEDIVGHCV